MKKILKKIALSVITFTLLLITLKNNVWAVQQVETGSGGQTPIFAVKNWLGWTNLGEIIKVLIQLAFFVAGLALFFNLVIGGIQWINAGGDEKALSSARRRITNSIIGLIIVVAAGAITGIVSQVFGISILNGFVFR